MERKQIIFCESKHFLLYSNSYTETCKRAKVTMKLLIKKTTTLKTTFRHPGVAIQLFSELSAVKDLQTLLKICPSIGF